MKRIILFSFGITLLFFACTKIPDHAKYIPKDAQFVAAVDMNKMGKKLIWNALTGSELMKEMQKNISNEETKNAMKDISNIGLNQQSTVYLFYSNKKQGFDNTTIVVSMKEVSKFEAYIKKVTPNSSIHSAENYSWAQIDSNLLAAWNKDVALFYPLAAKYGSDSSYLSIDLNNVDSIKSSLSNTFKLSGSSSITSNTHFSALQKAGHDVTFWLNYETIYTNNVNDTKNNPFIKKDYFKDAALATGLDFEKGKVNAVMDYYMNNEMASIYKKFEPKNIDLNLIKNIPSKDIGVLFGYNMNPAMINEYLKKFGLDGILNMGLSFAGTNMENITKTFNGDVVFALSDMKMNVRSATEEENEQGFTATPDMNMLFAMNVKDEKALENLMGVGVKNNMLTKNGSNYILANSDGKAALSYSKKQLVYCTNSTLVSTFMEGKMNSKEAFPASVWDHFSANPMVMYVDMKKIMQMIPLSTDKKEEEVFIAEAKKLFTYTELYGGKMKNKAVHVEGGLHFTNEEENALIQLLDIGMKAKKLKDNKEVQVPTLDTTLVQ